ncbi:MAG: hypothetical protein ACYSU8_05570 [Planctomycetota bacterium]|jgi:small-conductance mechanosensitive channel
MVDSNTTSDTATTTNIFDVDEILKSTGDWLITSGLRIFLILILGLDQFADSAIIIKARTKTKSRRQWAVAREFNRRLKKTFDELDIEIPFPHMTLYAGQNKDGSAPPLNVMTRSGEKM